jgi:hypothetical protein
MASDVAFKNGQVRMTESVGGSTETGSWFQSSSFTLTSHRKLKSCLAVHTHDQAEQLIGALVRNLYKLVGIYKYRAGTPAHSLPS